MANTVLDFGLQTKASNLAFGQVGAYIRQLPRARRPHSTSSTRQRGFVMFLEFLGPEINRKRSGKPGAVVSRGI